MFYVQTVGIMTTLAFKIFFYHVTPDFGHDIAKERGGVPAGEPLTSMVREIAAQARVTAAHDIAVYVVETDLAEAFAVALESPVVVMTRGLAVQADQVRAVIAHEIDHIHHGDSGFKMLKFSMVRGLKWTLKASFVLDAGRMVKVVGAVSWLAGELLFFAGGRSSEFAADAFAAEHASATGLVSFLSGLMDTDSEEVVLEGPLTREEHRRLHSLVAWKPKW
ncbi:hypothetical protein M885DRAFT_550366 [Pelagophyceae sp. CCMP2097]|nr:hypothetical protein M885DRAFT_550366 [Pelagophyceae sp. CCMP2097]